MKKPVKLLISAIICLVTIWGTCWAIEWLNGWMLPALVMTSIIIGTMSMLVGIATLVEMT